MQLSRPNSIQAINLGLGMHKSNSDHMSFKASYGSFVPDH